MRPDTLRSIDRQTLTDAGKFGDENYSKKELVAEIERRSSCSLAGIENQTIDNSSPRTSTTG